jgi:hypothetical protein
MWGYSAKGDLEKAIEYAKKALIKAPDDINKCNLADSIKKLESGQSL